MKQKISEPFFIHWFWKTFFVVVLCWSGISFFVHGHVPWMVWFSFGSSENASHALMIVRCAKKRLRLPTFALSSSSSLFLEKIHALQPPAFLPISLVSCVPVVFHFPVMPLINGASQGLKKTVSPIIAAKLRQISQKTAITIFRHPC